MVNLPSGELQWLPRAAALCARFELCGTRHMMSLEQTWGLAARKDER
ncbi:hypothetical protein HMPREF9004_0635 [Schaalia cardiffensis F0333]|uniref:Uncharacterized protein n=1 Tax=Schaalia cardiffensis F0333 TaxID=888050 RepID=N6X4E5_9ACTO|nr:hypothetical protein HMPREF9004_0635 [Schaalia cardiffensis F0333]